MTTDEQRLRAGWYSDPDTSAGERWWDGSQWTSHNRSGPNADAIARLTGQPPTDWSSGVQPLATVGASSSDEVPASAAASVELPYASTTVVMVQPTKSVGIALLLTFLFGPFGMFYSTMSGALFMVGVLIIGGLVVGVLTFGLAWIVWGPLVWFASMIWGSMAAADQSKTPVIGTYH